MTMNRHCIGIAALLAATIYLPAADWPVAYHDNQRTGVTAEELRPPLVKRWIFKSPLPPAKGWARPVQGYGALKRKPNVCYDDAFRVIAAGDMVWFASSAENRIYAIDAAKPAVKWTFDVQAAPRLAPVFHEGNVYFGADDGNVYCLTESTGKLVWKFKAAVTDAMMLGHERFSSVWPVRSGVMIEEGRLYFTAGLFPSEGIFMFVLDPADGSLIQRRQLDRGGYDAPSPQGYMLASKDAIWTTSRTAPDRWRKEDLSHVPFSTPCPKVKDDAYRYYNGGTEARIWKGRYMAYGMCCVLGFDVDKIIKDRWGRASKGDLMFNWFNARAVLFKGDTAYLATDYFLAAIKQKDLPDISRKECRRFEDAYKAHRVADYTAALERYEARVKLNGPDDAIARKLKDTSLKWGREKWESWPAARRALIEKIRARCIWLTEIKATEAMVLSGKTLFAGDDGVLFALNADTGEKIWEEKVKSTARALAVARNRLLVSTTNGDVQCFAPGLKARAPVRLLSKHLDQPEEVKSDEDRVASELADRILSVSGMQKGYCLIVGDGRRLKQALARKSRLKIQVAPSMEGAKSKLPYAPYLFNLVIDRQGVLEGRTGTDLSELFRVTKPCGGLAFISKSMAPSDMAFVERQNSTILEKAGLRFIKRGMMPGATNWTDQYATPANTSCSEDSLVKAPFGILWYGEPGPRKRIERHAAAPNPLCVDGIVYTIGYDRVMAFDAFNGVGYWEREIPGATRSGLPADTSNLVADGTGLYMVVNKEAVLHLDARTGETLHRYSPPKVEGAKHNFWSWITKKDGLLLGSRAMVDARRKRADRQRSEGIFAVDPVDGKIRWQMLGRDIDHNGIAVADGKIFFADRILNDAEKGQALENTVAHDSTGDRRAVDRRGNPVAPDLRKIVALDLQTGKTLWEVPFNLSDITLDDLVVANRRSTVNCMVKDGVLVVHGDGSIGHPHREFLKGEFKRRALYAFNAADGKFLWGGRRNYRKRPLIVGATIYAEPHGWDLKTGKQLKVKNPLSGREQAFDFHRGYIGCSHLIASGAALFGNKEGLGCINLDGGPRFSSFSNMSFSCSLGAVPANGVMVVPEGRSGCTCATPVYTSIALYPKAEPAAWDRFLTSGFSDIRNFPVLKASVNYGAPGLRRDRDGSLWINKCDRRGTSGVVGRWMPDYTGNKSQFYHVNQRLIAITGTERPWLFASGFEGAGKLRLKLIDKEQPPAKYKVTLFFCEIKDVKAGDRVFDVKLQGKKVLPEFDVVKASGSVRTALIRTFDNVAVNENLEIELSPAGDAKVKKGILCAVQVTRQ